MVDTVRPMPAPTTEPEVIAATTIHVAEPQNAVARNSKSEVMPGITNPAADYDEQVPRSKTQVFVIMSGLFLSLCLSALDFTIVSLALLSISHDLGSAAGYSWIGTSYLLANATSSRCWVSLARYGVVNPFDLQPLPSSSWAHLYALYPSTSPCLLPVVQSRGVQRAASSS
jgi:hypothetical protein